MHGYWVCVCGRRFWTPLWCDGVKPSKFETGVLLHDYKEPISGISPIDGSHIMFTCGMDSIQGHKSDMDLTRDEACERRFNKTSKNDPLVSLMFIFD